MTRKAIAHERINWNFLNKPIKGNAYEAIECSRRAYFFAPDEYRDSALVNMANVLHKQGFTRNATVLLESAVEINPLSSLNHFSVCLFFTRISEIFKR